MREGWKEVRLGDYANFRNGLNFKSENYQDGYKIIGVSDFGNKFIPDYSSLSQIGLIKNLRSDDFLEEGDFLFVRSNGNKNLIGRCLRIKNIKEKIVFSGFTIRCRLNENSNEIIFKDYLGYVFLDQSFLSKIRSESGGANIQNLNQQILSNFKINLPPLSTQQRIAEILSGYDDLIENNLKRIKLLEEMAQQTYEEWFVRMRFPGHESAVINPENGLPEGDALSLPKGWEKVKLSSIYELKYGKNLPQTQILQSGAFNVYGASGKMGFYDKNNINNKKVLVTSRGNGSGVVHRTHEKQSFVTNNSFIVNSKFKLGYTYYNLKHFDLSRFNSGSAQPQLTNSALDNVEIILPEVDIIFAFDENTSKSFELIDNLLIQNQRLREARDILLPRLMMGMIEV